MSRVPDHPVPVAHRGVFGVLVLTASVSAAALQLMEAFTRLGRWGHGQTPDASWISAYAPLALAALSIILGVLWLRRMDQVRPAFGWLALMVSSTLLALGVYWMSADVMR